MSLLLRYTFLLVFLAVANGDSESRRIATAFLSPRDPTLIGSSDIFGTVTFTETDEGLFISGAVSGLPPGKYGFHVHEIGNILTCDASGAHFNPGNTNHGGREHEVRHVGDLGNIEFIGDANVAVATVNMTDPVLTLRGPNNVLGRTLVLHEQEDDLGEGGHETSLTTGNAGARVACGVIGLVNPVETWSSAVTSTPSLFLYFIAALFTYFRI